MKQTNFLLAALFWVGCTPTQPPMTPTPEGPLQLTLQTDKTRFVLGENILIHFTVTNTGSTPITIEVGGDYRGAMRQTRFLVTAVDQDGKEAPDPYPSTMNMGGLVPTFTLKPNEQFIESLSLANYRELEKAGTYTITATHDLGLPKGTTPPKATVTITVTEPTPEQAKEILQQALSLPTDRNNTWGKRAQPYANFHSFRHPAYLPLVTKLAKDGDERGLLALSATQTPDATRALLGLLDSPHPEISSDALQALLTRVPGQRTQYAGHRLGGWDDSLKAPTLAAGWRLLSSNDREELFGGAYFVQNLATKESFPQALESADRILRLFANDTVEQDAYPRPITASDAMLDLLEGLLKAGATAPTDATTPARAAAFLLSLSQSGARPANWQATAVSLLSHEIPRIRALALEKLPNEAVPSAKEKIIALMEDPHLLVRVQACMLAERSKEASFTEPLIKVAATAQDQWLLGAAVFAAHSCKAPLDVLYETLAKRLDDPASASMVFDQMTGLVKSEGGSGSSGIDWEAVAKSGEVKTQWLSLISSQREKIKAGEKFQIGAPPLTPALFPKGFSFHRTDGSSWPVWE